MTSFPLLCGQLLAPGAALLASSVGRSHGRRRREPPPRGAHSGRIRNRPHPSARVRIALLICCGRSSVFAVIRIGRICKQGVGGSSPLVSTALIRPFFLGRSHLGWPHAAKGRIWGAFRFCALQLGVGEYPPACVPSPMTARVVLCTFWLRVKKASACPNLSVTSRRCAPATSSCVAAKKTSDAM